MTAWLLLFIDKMVANTIRNTPFATILQLYHGGKFCWWLNAM